MHTHHRKFRIGLVATAITLLAGCASAPSGTQITFDQLQDPATTPREKWSDAMIYMHAMGIDGMRDVPREYVDIAQATSPEQHKSQGVIDAPTVAISTVSPPTGMSGGAALGVGMGLMLLSAPKVQPAQMIQIAAWVPSDLAATPEEAAALAKQVFDEAHQKTFTRRIPTEISTTAYPQGDARIFDFRFPKKSNLVLFSAEAKASPEIVNSPMSYGPIFIYDHKVAQEAFLNTSGSKNIVEVRRILQVLSAELPDWFVIYDPDKTARKITASPPAILHKGKEHFFVGK